MRLKPSQWARALLMLGHALKTQPSLDYVWAVSGTAWAAFAGLTIMLALFGHLMSLVVMRLPLRYPVVALALMLGAADALVTVGILYGISKVTQQPLQIIALSSAVWFGVWLPLLALLWPVTLIIRIAEAKESASSVR